MKGDGRGVVAVVAYAVFMDYLIYGLIVPLTPYSPAGAMSENHMALLYSSYALGVLARRRCSATSASGSAIGGP